MSLRRSDARQGDMFALLDAPPPLFAKQLAADSAPARELLADLQQSASDAFADASLIDELPWRDQPDYLQRVREINGTPRAAVAAMMGAAFTDRAVTLLDRAMAETGKDVGFKIDAGLLARRIAACAKAAEVDRIHVAEALAYLIGLEPPA